MPDLDLIPFEYRQELLVRHGLKIFCLIYVVLLACVGGAKYVLHDQNVQMKQQVSIFEVSRKEANRKQHVLSELEQDKKYLEKRALIKDRLTRGPSAQQMFLVMDRSLDETTWFKRWVFQRPDKFSDIEMEPAETQFSLSVPAANNNPQVQASTTRMDIKGQAINHTKLAILIHNLATQPEFEDVKVIRTSQGRSKSTEVLDFDLVIRVRDGPGG